MPQKNITGEYKNEEKQGFARRGSRNRTLRLHAGRRNVCMDDRYCRIVQQRYQIGPGKKRIVVRTMRAAISFCVGTVFFGCGDIYNRYIRTNCFTPIS